ncbi:MAG: hypothetical protein Q8L11_00330 [Candidatus Moranbacteria bacterium]|nr:hypothetical protein [Candidatus Moranbacteria bacterium]
MIKSLLKNYLFYAIIFCVSFFFLALFSVEGFNWKNLKYTGTAITSDEFAHITAGYYYLKTGRYFFNSEHPPLVKDISALPLLLIDPYMPKINTSNTSLVGYTYDKDIYPFEDETFSRELERTNDEWDFGHIFLFNQKNDPDIIALYSRIGVIFFNSIFLFVLFWLIGKLWSPRASLLSIFFIVFSQFSIAHGSLVTMDFMSSILQLIALSSFAIYLKRYVENKNILNWYLLSALFSSLALLAKFSSLVILPAMFIGGLIYIIVLKKSLKEFGKYLVRFSSFTLATLLLVSFVYYFHTRNMTNNEMVSQIVYNYTDQLTNKSSADITGAVYLSAMVISNPITKGFAEYLSGILMVSDRMNMASQRIYFLGNVYEAEGAGVSYFPILYLTKLPLQFLFLGGVVMLFVLYYFIFNKKKLSTKFINFTNTPLSLLLLLFIYLYSIITLSSNFQIGLRHIMPIILAISLLVAKGIDFFWNESIFFKFFKIKYIFSLVAVFLVISVISTFPNYLPYYNYFGGGIDNGYKIATDSNYDWGQDIKELGKWVQDNKIEKIYTNVFSAVPLKYYFGDTMYENYDIAWWGLPKQGSYIAVSATNYQNNIFYREKYPVVSGIATKDELLYEKRYSILKDNLVARIGKTIFIFRVPEIAEFSKVK